MIVIKRDQEGKIEPNFTYKELYCKSVFPPTEHPYDDRIVRGLQKIRDYMTNKKLKIGIKVTSTYRPIWGNWIAGGVPNSQHLKGKATDWQFVGEDANQAYEIYRDQIIQKAYLFKKLRELGISGIGLYMNFNHLDTRDPEKDYTNSEDSEGKYSYWNNYNGLPQTIDEAAMDFRLPLLGLLGLFLLFKTGRLFR